jgi:hypothetical protein
MRGVATRWGGYCFLARISSRIRDTVSYKPCAGRGGSGAGCGVTCLLFSEGSECVGGIPVFLIIVFSLPKVLEKKLVGQTGLKVYYLLMNARNNLVCQPQEQ